MSIHQQLRPGISRRDVGAGAVAGVTALLANVLFHASLAARMIISNPATVLLVSVSTLKETSTRYAVLADLFAVEDARSGI